MSMFARAAPGARDVLGERGGVRVVVDLDREPEPLRHARRESRARRAGCSPTPRTVPVRWSIRDGKPEAEAATSSSSSSSTASSEAVEQLRLRARAASASRDGAPRVPRDRRGPRGSSSRRGRPRSPVSSCATDNVTRRMPGEEKPYRVYRGGRQKGKVPLQTRSGRAAARAGRADGSSYRGPGPITQRKRWSRGRWIKLAILLAPPGDRRLGGHRLPLAPARRREGQQASASRNRGGARLIRTRSSCSSPDEHPPARHRSLELAGARVAALRLDHGHSHRSAAPPHRVPLDPTRPARPDRGRRRHEDQRRDVRREARRSRSRRSPRTRACRSTT